MFLVVCLVSRCFIKMYAMSQTASSVLMVRPACFGYNTETSASNVFQNKQGHVTTARISQQAIKEFDGMVQLLKSKKIHVTVVRDTKEPPKPDAVFPNNWFCTLPDGTLVIFPMFAANRRTEKRDDVLQELCDHFHVRDVEDWSEYEADNFFLEGTGSMVFDHENKIVYACLSERTHRHLFESFARKHRYKSVAFAAKDANGVAIYHTNVMMHIGDTYAVVCLDSVANQTERIFISETLEQTEHEVIAVSQQQIRHFAGNMIQIKNTGGEKYTVLSRSAFDCLTEEQKSILSVHTNLLPVNIDTIETTGGGSARCMIAEIFLEKKG